MKPIINPKGDKLPPKKFHPRGGTLLYEDRNIIVISKRNGILTVSTGDKSQNTLYSQLTDYVKKGNSKSRNRVFIVHRLDKDTSGLLIFAKNYAAKEKLQSQWQSFTKKYIAKVCGKITPETGIITSYLTENPKSHRVFSTDNKDKGKFSETHYKTITVGKGSSTVEVTLKTGRKNQIRVHFSEKDFPICGDKKYGNQNKKEKRLFLHSSEITFQHPTTEKWVTFTDTPRF